MQGKESAVIRFDRVSAITRERYGPCYIYYILIKVDEGLAVFSLDSSFNQTTIRVPTNQQLEVYNQGLRTGFGFTLSSGLRRNKLSGPLLYKLKDRVPGYLLDHLLCSDIAEIGEKLRTYKIEILKAGSPEKKAHPARADQKMGKGSLLPDSSSI
jgi:hypothetical protein